MTDREAIAQILALIHPDTSPVRSGTFMCRKRILKEIFYLANQILREVDERDTTD